MVDVSCIIPTRGDCDLTPVLEVLPQEWEFIIWDNSKREDMGAYGRYAGIPEASHDLIFSIDDDVIFRRAAELVDVYEPGKVAVNYQEPWDIPWGGRGTIFHRDLPEQVFALYGEHFPRDHEFHVYYADGIFSMLTQPIAVVVDYGYEDLPIGFAPGRLSTSPGWYDYRRPEMFRRAAIVREAVAA